MVFIEEELERLNHSHDFFLAHLLTAAQSVLVRTVVEQRMGHQFFTSNQHAGALRSTDRLPAAERNQVIAHIGVVPQMRNRRRIGCGIIHARDVVLLRQLYPLVHLDLPRGIGEIRKVHHRRALIYCGAQLILCFDHHQLDSRGTQLVIKRIAMRLLNDDFRLHPCQIRQLPD